MISRADRSAFAEWWWTVDRVLIASLVLLVAAGIVVSLSASPPVAERLGLPASHFTLRHVLFAVPALVLMIGLSFLTPRQVRLAALALFGLALVLTIATLFVGMEAKGARRWLYLGGFSLQPAEFVKPAFVVLVAFLFAEGTRRPEVPGRLLAIFLLAMVVAPLIAQPDFGQAMLVGIVWCAMFFLAGMAWRWVFAIGLTGLAGLAAAYWHFPHVGGRIDRFLDPSSGDTYQIDTAIASFVRGGWFGEGPGEGDMKRILPDAHTDFVFAVTAEEFGIVACAALVLLIGFIVLRGLAHATRERDGFASLAIGGLVVLFGVQASINMAVNLHLIPSKGMTLPFVSYGGSSMLAVAIGMGFVLALSRRRPRPIRFTAYDPERAFPERAPPAPPRPRTARTTDDPVGAGA